MENMERLWISMGNLCKWHGGDPFFPALIRRLFASIGFHPIGVTAVSGQIEIVRTEYAV
jgi:hypothetical protein